MKKKSFFTGAVIVTASVVTIVCLRKPVKFDFLNVVAGTPPSNYCNSPGTPILIS